jgi:ubiquinone/menaquinone biosynthesis C-methylase UbiE
MCAMKKRSRRNHKQLKAGLVELRLGTVHSGPSTRLPFGDRTFNAAMAINCLHLWQDPKRGLQEVARTLKPGGRIAVAVSRYSYASPDRFEQQLVENGFSNVRILRGERGPCALANVVA